MPFDYIGAAMAAAGALGLGGETEQERAQAEYYRQAAALDKLRAGGLSDYLDLARVYDPAADDQKAIDYAGNVAADKLGKSLSSLNQTFRNAGGSPGGDTAFRVDAQGAANRVADPLKLWAAQMASTQTQRKLAALNGAVNSGGDIADNYLKLAQSQQTDPGGALAILSGGLQRMYSGATSKAPMATPAAAMASNAEPQGSGMGFESFTGAGTMASGYDRRSPNGPERY